MLSQWEGFHERALSCVSRVTTFALGADKSQQHRKSSVSKEKAFRSHSNPMGTRLEAAVLLHSQWGSCTR